MWLLDAHKLATRQPSKLSTQSVTCNVPAIICWAANEHEQKEQERSELAHRFAPMVEPVHKRTLRVVLDLLHHLVLRTRA
jgi:hypothetical protein